MTPPINNSQQTTSVPTQQLGTYGGYPPASQPQPQNVFVTAPAPVAKSPNVTFASESALVIGSFLIVCGFLMFCFTIALIASRDYFSYAGSGIWCGIITIIAGSFGVAAAKKKLNCLIITFMVMSIVAASLLIVPLILLILTFAVTTGRCYRSYHSYSCRYLEVYVGIGITMLLVVLLAAMFSIWGSVIACKAVCACCRATSSQSYVTSTTQNTQYIDMSAGTTTVVVSQGGVVSQPPVVSQYQPVSSASFVPSTTVPSSETGQTPPPGYPISSVGDNGVPPYSMTTAPMGTTVTTTKATGPLPRKDGIQ